MPLSGLHARAERSLAVWSESIACRHRSTFKGLWLLGFLALSLAQTAGAGSQAYTHDVGTQVRSGHMGRSRTGHTVEAPAHGTARSSARLTAQAPTEPLPLTALEAPVPAVTYPSSSLFTEIAAINGENAPDYHGTAFWYGGHLGIVFAKGMFEGGLSLFDISDPYHPVLVGKGDNAFQREGHATGFVETSQGWLAVTPASNGINLWDLNTPTAPTVAKNISLPGVLPSDYDFGAWWVAAQAPYIFVAGAFNGLYVVDISDLTRPRVLTQVRMEGGFRCGALFVVGNLLYQFSSEGAYTRVFDISDPANPLQIKEIEQAGSAYGAYFNGGYLYLARESGGMEIMDVRDLTAPKTLSYLPLSGGGAYAVTQDNYVFEGNSDASYKLNATDKTKPSVVGSFKIQSSLDVDHDFISPIGNLMVVSDDHNLTQFNIGSRLVPHQSAPDTTPPVLNFIQPANGSVGVPLTARFGATFTDQIMVSSVNASSVTLKKADGTAATLRFSVQEGLVNVAPTALEPETTYTLSFLAGGIRDYAGNALSQTTSVSFTTGPQLVNPPIANAGDDVTTTVNSAVTLTGDRTRGGVGTLQYRWDPGDGSPTSAWSTQSAYNHTYTSEGHFTAILSVKDSKSQVSSDTKRVTAIYAPLAAPPTHSATMAYDALNEVVWVVNPDANTVSAIDSLQLKVMKEIPVGSHPVSLTLGPEDTLWVANQESHDVSVIDTISLTEVDRILLQPGGRPGGIVADPELARLYVSLEGLGEVWALDGSTGATLWESLALSSPRALAVVGSSLFVSRFISPVSQGEVYELDRSTGSVLRAIALAESPGPDSDINARGIPNYLNQLVPTPDGRQLLVPSIKQNTSRGVTRDGQALTFESTNRAILSTIELGARAENLSLRLDFDNRDHASAAGLSPDGDYVYVTLQGSQGVMIVDRFSGQDVGFLPSVGHAPAGALATPDGLLFIQNYMSRNVVAYDVATQELPETVLRVATLRTIADEPLSDEVLVGKRIFYNASDLHMSRDSYISCAGCHLDGGTDKRVWDFTDRGEGLRRSTLLRGRAGMLHGPVHWTANFDEIQDFENDIRNAFKGTGFLSDADWSSGTHSQTLGDKKAGLSPELDAMAAYVATLSRADESPYRTASGTLSAAASRGRDLFLSSAVGCATCHTGPHFTDSVLTTPANFVLHDVGTITAASGKRMGQPLTGLDTPTLKGTWNNAPYFHDGSGNSIKEVLTTRNAGDKHGKTSQLSSSQVSDLEAYVLSIDARSGAPVVVGMDPKVGSTVSSMTRLTLSVSSYPSPATVSASNLKVLSSTGVSISGTWSVDRDTVSFVPSAALTAGAYTVSITTGLKSIDGEAASSWSGSFTVGSPALVSNVRGWSGRTYTLKSGLKRGVRIYSDEDDEYPLKLPTAYQNLAYIQTANGDREQTRPGLLTFDLGTAATVFVAIDRRQTCLPGWMSEFVATGESLTTTDIGSPVPVYKARFKAGKVLLGGTRADCPGRNEQNQYFVMVQP